MPNRPCATPGCLLRQPCPLHALLELAAAAIDYVEASRGERGYRGDSDRVFPRLKAAVDAITGRDQEESSHGCETP